MSALLEKSKFDNAPVHRAATTDFASYCRPVNCLMDVMLRLSNTRIRPGPEVQLIFETRSEEAIQEPTRDVLRATPLESQNERTVKRTSRAAPFATAPRRGTAR